MGERYYRPFLRQAWDEAVRYITAYHYLPSVLTDLCVFFVVWAASNLRTALIALVGAVLGVPFFIFWLSFFRAPAALHREQEEQLGTLRTTRDNLTDQVRYLTRGRDVRAFVRSRLAEVERIIAEQESHLEETHPINVSSVRYQLKTLFLQVEEFMRTHEYEEGVKKFEDEANELAARLSDLDRDQTPEKLLQEGRSISKALYAKLASGAFGDPI